MQKIKFPVGVFKPALRQIKIIGAFFLAVFLLLNIASSQVVPPLYFYHTRGVKEGSVMFLQQVRSLPIFEKELENYKNIFGETIENEVFREELIEKEKIKYFEQILEKNPYSRDILYSLYRLNMAKGDQKTANEYLKRAGTVDPDLK